MMTIKSSLQLRIAIVKAFLMQIFCPVKNWLKICIFGGNGVEMWNFVFGIPKRHILVQNDIIWRTDRENQRRLLCTALPESPKN